MAEPDAFSVRRVVAGTDPAGAAAFISDRQPPRTISAPNGFGVSELVWFDAHPVESADGDDPGEGSVGGFPANGAIAARLIRFAAATPDSPTDETWVRVAGEEPDRPGMHRSDTLDLMVVLEGQVLLGLEDGEHEVGPGVAVIQRGTTHRWRVIGSEPCTFLSVLISAATIERATEGVGLSPGLSTADVAASTHRLVTETSADGRSRLSSAAAPPQMQAGGVAIRDLWQTGGPVGSTEQGGDAAGAWALEPDNGGICLRTVEFAAGHDPGPAGFHRTDTIDIDLVLSGSLELTLRDDTDTGPRTILPAGDVVVMRAVTHRWRPAGSEPAAMATVMIALAPAG